MFRVFYWDDESKLYFTTFTEEKLEFKNVFNGIWWERLFYEKHLKK